MGYYEGTMKMDDPVIVYLNEKIRLQRFHLEWLLERRLPEAEHAAVSQIEFTLNDGNIQFASVHVNCIQECLNTIKEASTNLQNLLRERTSLLGTELSEEIHSTEQKFFEANGRRWTTEPYKNS